MNENLARETSLKSLRHPTKEGRTPSLVVHIYGEKDSKRQSIIWNHSDPVPLGHPFQWILEKTSQGIRVRNLSTPYGQISSHSVLEISEKDFGNGKKFKLPQEKSASSLSLSIRIDKYHLLPPAYVLAEENLKNEAALSKLKLRAYTCHHQWITEETSFENTFIGKQNGKKAFRFQRRQNGFEIEALCDQIEIRSKKKTSKVARGQKTELSREDLATASVGFQDFQWRFTALEAVSIPKETISEDSLDPSYQTYQKSLKFTGIGLSAFLLLILFWPASEKEAEEVVPTQYAKIVLSDPAPQDEMENSSAESDQATTAENTQVVQAFRASALQNTVQGLLKGGMSTLLAQSDFVNSNPNANKIFNFNAKSPPTARMGNLLKGRDVKVASLGGKSKTGVGYGKGKRAGVKGQGGAFVGLDTTGYDVAQGLTKDEVGRVIHAHLSEVRYCYESAMVRNADTQGKLLVAFTIAASGNVSSTAVKDTTLGDPRLDDCILRRLAKWKFPKPKGGVKVAVSYPFIFKSLDN